MNRRFFIKTKALMLGGLSIFPASIIDLSNPQTKKDFISQRPAPEDRTFRSEAIEKKILEIKKLIGDEELAWMFENCFPNTLDTTVDFEIINGEPDTFIITGDIDAMWLRDSTAQVWPYMPLIKEDLKLKQLVKGLIRRQVKCVLKDPYANAFYKDLSKRSHWENDEPSPIPGVHERKWEIDSLCYVVRLSNKYYELTSDDSIFDKDWDTAMRLIYDTFRTEQRKDNSSPYYFRRRTTAMIDAPTFNGTGRPLKPVGLIASMFRPSDDATMYPFLIPSNIFAALSLSNLWAIYSFTIKDHGFAEKCMLFSNEIFGAVQNHAISEHLHFRKIYAYEIDGFGNKLFMDDANVPSLMSLGYLVPEYADDPIYQRTRRFLLSDSNPYFLKGKIAEGQASPHTGKEKIWPMGIILRAMTSTDDIEITYCLKLLKSTHAGTGFMHEAFHKDDATDFNRAWFAWANTLFGELIIKLSEERPHILKGEIE